MPLILGLESTCDETAAAVVRDGTHVLSNAVASSADLHAAYGGVVPEIASRAQVEFLWPVLERAVADAGVTPKDLDAVAVANRPGLIGSLLVGLTAAKTLAWAWGKPLVGVDHVRAHLWSVMLGRGGSGQVAGGSAESDRRAGGSHGDSASCHLPPATCPLLPAIGLVASGGHTALYDVRDWLAVARLGGTIDDAVGEAYDKVAAMLGLGYPGGPVIDALAATGDPAAIKFPRPMLGRESLDFSFSGLKTSVLYHVRGHAGRERPAGDLGDAERADVCASFQAACVDVIVRKLKRAAKRTGAKSVVVGGGVSANAGLRAALSANAGFPLPVHLPGRAYCTDNAAMIAGYADVLLRSSESSGLDLDASPSSADAA